VIWLKTNGEKQFSIDSKRMAVIGGSAAGYLALSTGLNLKSLPQAVIAISTPTDYSNSPPKGNEEVLKQPGPYDIVKDKPLSYGDYSSRMQLWRFLAKNKLVLSEIFGFDVSQDKKKLKEFMLTEQITKAYPPTLLVHARNDHLVPLQQVEKFQIFLANKGVDSELYIVENGHSTELIKNNPDALQRIIKFLDKYLKSK
jgi:acetyl esterase/lipase